MQGKDCPRCNTYKLIDEFYVRSDRKGVTHSYCKGCVNIQTKERQRNLKIQAVSYKGGCCSDCGGVFPMACYDFHHEDPNEKDFAISKVKSPKWSEVIVNELDKCTLLCANCHRIRHSK